MVNIESIDNPLGFAVTHKYYFHDWHDSDRQLSSKAVQSSPPPPSMPNESYPSGWYPDPTRRYEFRFYNGQVWTGDVSNQGQRLLDPLPGAGSGTAPYAAFAPVARNGHAIAAFVLALGSVVVGWVPFVCFLALIAVVLAVIFGIIGLRRSRVLNRCGRSLAVAALALAPLGAAVSAVGVWLTQRSVAEFTDFVNVGDYSLTDISCNVRDSVVTYEGEITNNSAQTQSYHLTFEFSRSGTGNALYSASDDVSNVGPGQVGRWTVRHRVQQDALDCRVSGVSGPIPFQS